MEYIDTLAEFYKHCLNVGGNTRPNNFNPPLYGGWLRCYISPYLVYGKVENNVHPTFKENKGEEFCIFKNLLLYTLQDYIDFISLGAPYKNDETINKTKFLISELENLENDRIIYEIEKNKDKFPKKSDCYNSEIIPESYNDNFKI